MKETLNCLKTSTKIRVLVVIAVRSAVFLGAGDWRSGDPAE